MLPVTHVLAFGAWLVAQSKATPSAPTISIFLKPPGVIPPGGSTTICCSCQHGNGNFMLYKDGHQLRTLEQSGSRAEFSISNATYEDTGTYNCHYLEGGTVLARSDGLDVMVTGERCAVTPSCGVTCPMCRLGCMQTLGFPIHMMGRGFLFFPGLERWGPSAPSSKPFDGFMEILAAPGTMSKPCMSSQALSVPPGIRLPGPDLSVLPGHEVTAGTHVIFRCTPPHHSTGCFLYLEGQIRAQVLSREQDDYNFSHVQEGEGGRYSCQCFTKNASIEWSAVSKTLDLVVRDYTLCNAVRLALGAGLLVLLGLITAEATRGRCCRGGRAHPLPAGSAPLTATSVGTPGFPSRASRWDK
ncbi:LOW QUALITY PROTEIN: leukocyte immunoglobulin-like receptor subfamily B member 5 [Pipra filicauda]|uniref:LOW QUALITY PROTEIN: leukocyte immunoglobulin-like receptor subfamily B member 5 n=1 Tax=Pipra filicauda TaxID=649802 RepID=A0A7R5KDP7_9PASS|nr:LOW QUALITY PROTEIN: leukocyte immunoglobulin-like receptor subfamily B member 5 [Pipra filicauda]